MLRLLLYHHRLWWQEEAARKRKEEAQKRKLKAKQDLEELIKSCGKTKKIQAGPLKGA